MLKITENIKLGKLVGSSCNAGGNGGSSNYNDLENKPMINGFELTGDQTGSDLGLIDSASDSWQYVNGPFGCFDTFDLSGKEDGNLQIYASPNDITFATSSIPLNLLAKTYFNESPTVGTADSFENASDDTLMTKAQVIEYVQSVLNNF